MKKSIFTLIVLLVFASGCVNQAALTPETVTDVTIQTASVPAEATEEWLAQVIFSRGRQELAESIAVSGNSLALTVQIPVGTWDVTMRLVDENDIPNYQDTIKDVTIFPDQPLNLDFQLQPAQGTINVIVDLEGFPQAESILRVRVHFDDEVKEIKRDFPNEPLTGQYQLLPGSHNFNVELFTGSFRSTDKVDDGLWQVIDIEPLSEQTFIWQPALEDLTISADIHLMPNSPTNLQGKYLGSEIELTWEQSPSEFVTEYLIYCQADLFSPFKFIGSVPASQNKFIHDLSDLAELPLEMRYSVAAGSAVLTGYRTNPIVIKLD